jgi:UDP-glucose 4-epimerase
MSVAIESILGKIGPLQVFGNDYPTKDGTGVRDYIHPSDLATGHIAALEYLLKNKKTEVINLGCGKGYSVFEVISALEKASKNKVQYKVVDRRSGDPAISYADPSKAEKLLGWKAQFNLSDMAKTAWKWHSTHPNGYESNH